MNLETLPLKLYVGYLNYLHQFFFKGGSEDFAGLLLTKTSRVPSLSGVPKNFSGAISATLADIGPRGPVRMVTSFEEYLLILLLIFVRSCRIGILLDNQSERNETCVCLYTYAIVHYSICHAESL